jgi:hypothetical protein
MTHMKKCSNKRLFLFFLASFLIFLVFLTSFVNAEKQFGEIQEGDDDSSTPPHIKTDWGGKEFNFGDGQKLKIKYKDNSLGEYGPGKYVVSEYGKIVEADFEVKRDGEYILGNQKINLKSGSKVTLKDGEIKIENPGSMIKPDEIDFIDSDLGWGSDNIKLTGEGIEYLNIENLEEIGLDKGGFYLTEPKGVKFDDFTIHGNGRVYLLGTDNANPNLEVNGAYISVDSANNKFVIGSNKFGEWISVRPDSKNKYGILHDVESDYIAFKSVGGGQPSYFTLEDRTSNGLVPKADAVGFFVVDNNGKSTYMGYEDKIYTVPNNHLLSEFEKPSTTTSSPIELHMKKMHGGEVVELAGYKGVIGFGNENSLAYGSDPTYMLAGKYQKDELRHGVSNLLAYNYYTGGKDLITNLFDIRIDGSRQNILNDPKNGKFLMDLLFQTPKKYRDKLKSLSLESNVGTWDVPDAIAWGGYNSISLGVDSGAFRHRTIAHELGHVFDFNYGGKVDSMIGRLNIPFVPGAYSDSSTERQATFLEQRFSSVEGYWKKYFNGDKRTQRAIAAFTIAEGMTFYQGKTILEGIGAGKINNMEDIKKILS